MDDEDDGQIWRDLKAIKSEKRASNRISSEQMLIAAGVNFTSNNAGAHLIVQSDSKTIDFWPGTGLWIVRGNKKRHRGVRGLIKLIKPTITEN